MVVEAFGGPTKMAQALGVTRQIVYYWRDNGGVPPEYWPPIHKATGLTAKQIAPEYVVA